HRLFVLSSFPSQSLLLPRSPLFPYTTLFRSSYSQCRSSLITVFYEPKPFITHAALLHQACAHCGRFPTAASRRSMGRVSVPLWPISLSTRLRIIALVSHYLTN